MSEASRPAKETTEIGPEAEPLSAALLARWYALSGACWFALASLFLSIGLIQLGFGAAPPMAPLGLGRLHVAYRFVALFGAIALPPAGLLVRETLESDALLLRARRGLQIWNAGLIVGCIGILAGMLRAEPAAGAPAFAEILVWIGALLWFWAIASALLPRPGIRAGEAFGLLAGIGLLVLLLLGMLLTTNLRGHGQALASTMYLRGLVDLWAVPLGLSTAAILLPKYLRVSHHGRRALLFGLFAWPILAVLGLSRDLAPDILAPWLIRPAEAFSSLAMVAVAALAIGLFGSFIGSPRPWREREDLQLIAAGLILLLGSMWMESWRLPSARRLFMLGPSSVGSIFPAWSGLFLMALAAGRALIPSRESEGFPFRRVSMLATVLGLSMLALPGMAAGLAEAAVGGSAELLGLQSRIRLPGALILSFGIGVWLFEAFERSKKRDDPEVPIARELPALDEASTSGPVDAPGFPGASVVMASSLAILAAGLIVSILVPLADPALDEPGLRAGARDLDAKPLRAEGRETYTREACAVCHSQRVRAFEAGASMGPATGAGDFAGVPAHSGQRRAGADLSWAGDHPSLIDNLPVVHAPGGFAPMPWLFETGGPTSEGEALIDYLEGLTARAGSDDQNEGASEEAP